MYALGGIFLRYISHYSEKVSDWEKRTGLYFIVLKKNEPGTSICAIFMWGCAHHLGRWHCWLTLSRVHALKFCFLIKQFHSCHRFASHCKGYEACDLGESTRVRHAICDYGKVKKKIYFQQISSLWLLQHRNCHLLICVRIVLAMNLEGSLGAQWCCGIRKAGSQISNGFVLTAFTIEAGKP